MSPNQQQQAQQGHATQEQNRQSLLDQVLEQTPKVQSIRNTAAQFLGVPPERVCDLLRNVWRTSKGQPELTDAEMFAGMSMIARFGLDPIAREVYVTRTSKGLVTIIGIDGWIKVLNRTEGYDGFEQSEEWDEAGNLKCVETRIYTKERSRPTTYRGYAKEYARMAGVVAQNMPWHMLRLFSLRHAARLFTPIGGSVVTEEEARWMDAYAATPEEDRTRKNVLRDRVKTAASEFEPIPQGEQEQPLTAVEAALPPNPPTTEERQRVDVGLPVNGEADYGDTRGGADAATHDQQPQVVHATPAELVAEYQAKISRCQSVKDANTLVTAAQNDPRLTTDAGCPAETITYVSTLLQGCVTREKQKKAQKLLT